MWNRFNPAWLCSLRPVCLLRHLGISPFSFNIVLKDFSVAGAKHLPSTSYSSKVPGAASRYQLAAPLIPQMNLNESWRENVGHLLKSNGSTSRSGLLTPINSGGSDGIGGVVEKRSVWVDASGNSSSDSGGGRQKWLGRECLGKTMIAMTRIKTQRPARR